VLADGFRHLEHIQSGFSKDLFQLIIGHDLPPLIWVLQFMLFDVGPHLLRDLVGIWERVIPISQPVVVRALRVREPSSKRQCLSFS
jgi:hypothetical protein